METRLTAQALGVIVAALAIVGLFVGDRLLFGLMNVDLALDLLRIPVAAALLYAGFGSPSVMAARNILIGVGVLYVGMALLGAFSRELFGLLPSGLTNFDLAFHLVAGVVALWAGLAHATERRISSHQH